MNNHIRATSMKRVLSFLLTCTLACAGVAQAQTARLSDEALLDSVQSRTLRYFTAGAEPVSGMALERIHLDTPSSPDIITSGGSGFGMMALIAGMERGFIPRKTALEQLTRMMDFLERADRFHGAFPHWWNGKTGQVQPFTEKDNGGDLVETAFLSQALICLNRYLLNGTAEEQALARRADTLWREVEWDWFTRGENTLYWHWSPDHEWAMNMPVRGYNECLVVYVLAAASPTHSIDPEVYHQGWAQGGDICHHTVTEGDFSLQLNHGHPNGGPLFWAHYSYLGLDPRGLNDRYADYFKECKNQTLANRAYCLRNPHGYAGYGEQCWGLTASYSIDGYFAHAPHENTDKGVIAPTAALSSLPYAPEQVLPCIRYFYEELGEKLWGTYGFYDAFSIEAGWYPQRYLAIDQGPIAVMIENYRSGLLWELFMSHPDVQRGLRKLGFRSPYLSQVSPDTQNRLNLTPANAYKYERVFVEQQDGVDNFGGWSSETVGNVPGRMAWMVHVPRRGNYNVSAELKAAGASGQLNLHVGNRTYNLAYTTCDTYATQPLGTLYLEAGAQRVELTRTATSPAWQYVNLRRLTFAPLPEIATNQASPPADRPVAYVDGGKLHLSGLRPGCHIALYTIDGNTLQAKKVASTDITVDLAGHRGVLIVRITGLKASTPLIMRIWA